MNAANVTRTARLAPLLLLAGVIGCGSSPPPAWSLWPFDPPERVDYETPSARIDRLEALSARAAAADARERQQITAELIRHLRNEDDPLVREHIIRAIARSSDPATTAVLRAGLEDDSPAVRIACCAALSNQHDDETLSALAEVLRRDTDIDVRLAATRSLARFKRPAAISAMTVALEDRDPALQYAAVESLRQMTDVDYGNDVRKWLEFARGGRPQPAPSTLAQRLRRLYPF